MPMWTLYKIIDRTAYLLPVHPWQTAELSNKIQEVVEYTLDADLLYSACDARKELTGTMQLMSMLSDGSMICILTSRQMVFREIRYRKCDDPQRG